jgi:hypothetical protein
MNLSPFDRQVIKGLAPYPMVQPVATVARRIYPMSKAHRYCGAIGRTLRRLADQKLAVHTTIQIKSQSVFGGESSSCHRGWCLTLQGMRAR